jgi:hypothetical protein
MRAFRRIAIFDIDPELVSLPLSRALLCMNCERISNSRHQRCDVCGSSAILALLSCWDRRIPHHRKRLRWRPMRPR